MNRNKDGSVLSVNDLVVIALDHGLITEVDVHVLTAVHHHDSELLSKLDDITRKVRFDLFLASELDLDTRSDDRPVEPPWGLDAQVVRFLRR